jgi:hypothetical protein
VDGLAEERGREKKERESGNLMQPHGVEPQLQCSVGMVDTCAPRPVGSVSNQFHDRWA